MNKLTTDNNALLDYVEENENIKRETENEMDELRQQNKEFTKVTSEKDKEIELKVIKEKEYIIEYNIIYCRQAEIIQKTQNELNEKKGIEQNLRENKLLLENKLAKTEKELEEINVAHKKLEEMLNQSGQEKAKSNMDIENYKKIVAGNEDDLNNKKQKIQELTQNKYSNEQTIQKLSKIYLLPIR